MKNDLQDSEHLLEESHLKRARLAEELHEISTAYEEFSEKTVDTHNRFA